MSVNEDGIMGEELARLYVNGRCSHDFVMQLDWVYRDCITHKWTCIEAKYKSYYNRPPFDGTGLDIEQVERRMCFLADTGIRCMFIAFDKTNSKTYWQYLDVLEATAKCPKSEWYINDVENKYGQFDTKKNVRIYNFHFFNEVTTEEFNVENAVSEIKRKKG